MGEVAMGFVEARGSDPAITGAGVDQPIPRSRFDTRELPPAEALSIWNESINVIFDARASRSVDEGFFATVDAALIGEVALGRLTGAAQEFDRSRYKIAQDGMDGYLLQFYLRGESASRADDDLPPAREGDLYIIDMAQPVATRTSDHDQLTLVVPRRLLAPHLENPDGLHLHVASGALPLSAQDAEAALKPMIDLAIMAINSDGSKGAAPQQPALFMSVRNYVEKHLLDPGLSLETIIAAFNISRRTAYRLFEPTGGFLTYLNRRRLQNAMRMLRAPEAANLQMSQIAGLHLFPSAQNFSRAFRREFGMSPREARYFASGAEAGAPDVSLETAWSYWISQVGR
jgi:AraC-like DNA-binding protein